MRRTLIQLDESTYQRLREHAFREQRSMAAVVRELVVKGLQGERRQPTRASQFASVRVGRSKPTRRAPVSEAHDDALASAFEK